MKVWEIQQINVDTGKRYRPLLYDINGFLLPRFYGHPQVAYDILEQINGREGYPNIRFTVIEMNVMHPNQFRFVNNDG